MLNAIRNLLVNSSDHFSYDDIEDEIIAIIRKHVVCIVNKDNGYINSLNWIFANSSKPGEFSYRDCCEIVAVHPDLLRIRLQYEFYCRQLNFYKVFIGELPTVLFDEIAMLFIPNALNVVKFVWSNPGINIQQFELEQVNTDIIIQSLSEKEILGMNNGKLYVTGRIPKNLKNISWSKYWNFYD